MAERKVNACNSKKGTIFFQNYSVTLLNAYVINEHDLRIGKPVFEVVRTLSKYALTMEGIQDLVKLLKVTSNLDDCQIHLDSLFD